MKHVILIAVVLTMACTGMPSAAQQPNNRQPSNGDDASLSPEMWYYKMQLERYDDPKTAIRRKAEFVSQQRAARLEVMRWHGFSNARPTSSPTPFTSMYRPAWQSNWHRPYAWYTFGRPTIIVAGRNSAQ